MSSQVAQPPFTGDPCNIEGCRSTRYRFDERGIAICRNGHEHPEIQERVEADVIREGPIRGTTSRKRRVVEKARAGLQGPEAYELYLVCIQHILRKQVWWLVGVQGLPKELEQLVQGLWALRLGSLANRLNTTALSGDESDDRPTYASGSSSSGEESIRTLGPDAKLPLAAPPSLLETIAFCYLGIYQLRLPIGFADILSWIQNGQLTYYRAIVEIPREMRDQLAGTYYSRLEPSVPLTTKAFRDAVRTLFVAFRVHLNLVLPPLNWPLHLYRHVHELSLPLAVYQTVKNLNKLIGFSFEYPTALFRSKVSGILPEMQIIALVVIATKMLYPFRQPKLFPRSADEPAAMALDWNTWVQALEQSQASLTEQSHNNGPASLNYEKAMQITEADISSLADEQLDDYLDWYSDTWARLELRERDRELYFRQYLLDTFPTGPRARSPPPGPSAERMYQAQEERSQTVLAALTPRRVVSKEQEDQYRRRLPRPGEVYERFQSVEQLSDLAKVFHGEAARVAGIETKALLRAVHHAERRLELWVVEEQKSRGMGTDTEMSE